MDQETFIASIIKIAKKHNYIIEDSRNGLQIDFGHKKLHEGHLRDLYNLGILQSNVNIANLIKKVAPGRGCSHRPMRVIIDELFKI